jgi:hypothetical protein
MMMRYFIIIHALIPPLLVLSPTANPQAINSLPVKRRGNGGVRFEYQQGRKKGWTAF